MITRKPCLSSRRALLLLWLEAQTAIPSHCKHYPSPGFFSVRPPAVIAKAPKLPSCKQATGTTSEGPPVSQYRTHPPQSPHEPHNHPQCLSSARSSPSKLVSSRRKPRARESAGGDEAVRGMDMIIARDTTLTSIRNYSPAHVAVLLRRYDILGPDYARWMRARASAWRPYTWRKES